MIDIIKVSGFYITAKSNNEDEKDVVWTLQDDFYFDNQKELDDFIFNLKVAFVNYCGKVTVETFEAVNGLKNFNTAEIYKKANTTAVYSSSIGEAIHFELYESEKNDVDNIIIDSTTDEYWEILSKESETLSDKINNLEYSLEIAKNNFRLINNEFKFGKGRK